MSDDGYLPKEIQGHPVATDTGATSERPGVPAFVARPAGAPPYYGFPILDDVDVDGFRLGMITDFEAEATADGDSFVVAPDGSRAGLVWEVSPRGLFEEVYPADAHRWGVWAATFPFPMSSRENARRNLLAVLPELRRRWEDWRARFSYPGRDT